MQSPFQPPPSTAARLGSLVSSALRTRPIGWALLLSLIALLSASLASSALGQSGAGSQTLSRAFWSAGESWPAIAPTQIVNLPDAWVQSRPGYGGTGWYRLEFVSRPGAQALYLESLCGQFTLYLNGVALLSPEQVQTRSAADCKPPQLFALPDPLLNPERNTLDIQLSGESLAQRSILQRGPYLPALELGSLEVLVPRHAWAYFWSQSLPHMMGAMLVMMALTTGLLASLHRHERHVLYLSALMLFWALLGTRGHWGVLPQGVGSAIAALLMPLMALCMIQFLLCQLDRRHLRLDMALQLQCAAVPISLALVDPGFRFMLSGAWVSVLGIEVAAAAVWQLRQRWQKLKLQEAPLPVERQDFFVSAVLMGSALLALALQSVLPWQWTDMGLVQALVAVLMPLTLLGLGLHVTVGIARARNVAEHKHLQMELDLQERVADIERNFTAMADLKLEQVTERERKRIAADLHDDLGAKLLTIVHTSESDRISTLAREALEEMRLSVRGLTGKPVQLLDALGDWRAEVVSRLGQANILAEWKSPPEDIIHTLTARAYVQTTRIFREAVSNIIKHSGATQCIISCNVVDGDFLVVIQDNGQGIPAELDGRLDKGHGMASMKSRAKQMQGQCLVESGPGWGTVIRLTIPL